MIAKGITPEPIRDEWEMRAINWFLAHGASYDELTGDVIVRMISNVQGPSPTTRSVSPLTRPDRGRPTSSGWWAPVTCVYKEVGAAGTRYEVRRAPFLLTDTPSQSRVPRSSDRKHHRRHHLSPTFSPPPIAMATGSSSSGQGASYLSLFLIPLSRRCLSTLYSKSYPPILSSLVDLDGFNNGIRAW
jgi:hypothetical protein